MKQPTSRRAFLAHATTSIGALLLAATTGGAISRVLAAAEKKSGRPASDGAAVPKGPPPQVSEIRVTRLRGDDGKLSTRVLDDIVYGIATALTSRDLPPLDGLSELFPNDPPVVILVDPAHGAETSRLLAGKLAVSLVEMGSASSSVRVVGPSDADLRQAGYTVARSGDGPFTHGAEPEPGYGGPRSVEGTGSSARFIRSLDERSARTAVVARLSRSGEGMGPFVIDAALGALDPRTRAECVRDPALGARLVGGPLLGGRTGLVIGDLVEISLNAPSVDSWKADEILVGTSILAVESVGHTILKNTCLAKGLPPPAPHPILQAAAKLRLPGAVLDGIDWRKEIL